MKSKIVAMLGICLMLSLTLVSAIGYENVVSSYDRKSNTVSIGFDAVLENECSIQSIRIVDRKGNIVGGNVNSP